MTAPAQTWTKRGNLRGPQGETGVAGPPGSPGSPGVKGDTGATGGVGPSGQKGDAGAQGTRGAGWSQATLAVAGTVPDQTSTIVGDFLVDRTTGDWYERTA